MKKVLATMMAITTALSLAGCGGGSTATNTTAAPAGTTAAQAQGGESTEAAAGSSEWGTYNLKLATNLAEDHVACKGYYAFAEAVEKATDGHVTVTVYSGEQLGKESDVTSSVSMGAGTCDIVACGPSELSKYDPTFSIFDAPYVFNDGNAMVAFSNSEEVQPLYDALAASSNLRCLGMYYYGAREVTVKGFPATEPSGLAGCKLRVPDSEMAMAYGAALGATPTVMSLGEVYMGIQQGVVDGQENPLPTIDSNAFYEVCDNLLMTDHVIAAVTYTMDEKVWQSMPADLQEILQNCVKESCESITKGIQEQEAGLVDTLKENGMNIVEVDKEAFKANAEPIYEKYADTWGDWLATAQSYNK
ncbi:MAG: DctP family TRAP transporter solute-binding subunit [Clostridium sp.]|nr:DctP family TRAP transporter solute-binding subunit [Clostridium sp.]